MSNRSLTLLPAWLLLMGFLAGSLAAADAPGAKPNFIVFIADDHAYLDAEPYGATDVHTPNMMKLAQEGLRFNQAFVASPSCGPSRSAFLTGMWPARNGAEPNHTPPSRGLPGLPSALQKLGYEVVAIGKVAHGNFAKLYNFDYVDGRKSGENDTQVVAKYLATRTSTKPLCLFFGTHHPHAPWSDNEGYNPVTIKVPVTHVDTLTTRELRTQYYTDVTKTDALLGELRALVQKHVKGDTLVAYTADNGAQWPFGKWDCYEAGIHVPLIISWPGHIKPATNTDAMVCWPDMLPTFIELAGGTVPDGIDGSSYADVLNGTSSSHRNRIFAAHSGDGNYNVYPERCIRTQDWKLILNLHPEFQHQTHVSNSDKKQGGMYWETWLEAAAQDPIAADTVKRFVERPALELYDLKNDPFEQHNLATDPGQVERVSTMSKELQAWMKSQGDQEKVFGRPLLIGQPMRKEAKGAKDDEE